MSDRMESLLIVGHGSSSSEASAVLEQLRDLLRGRAQYDFVEVAYLSLSKPDIGEAIASLAERKAARIVIVPYFLFEGVHIQRDIPAIVAEAAGRFPGVDIRIAKPLGFDPALAEIVLRRADEARS